MKNLRINDNFKKLISAGMVLVTLSNFTGCSLNNSKEDNNSTSKRLETIVSDNKMILVSDLRLKDTKTNQIIDDVDKVLVNNKLEEGYSLIDIMFNSSVESVLIDNELVPVNRFKLVNSKTNEELDAIDYAVVGNELVSIKDYLRNSNSSSNYEYNGNTTSTQEGEYEELTDEKFYALVDEVYKKYSEEIGLDVTKEEVTDYVMMRNIEKISKDNEELISTIVGDRNSDTVILNMNDVYSAIKTYNDNNHCKKGLGWDSFILVSDAVFDKETKEKVVAFESRIKELFDARGNKEEFNILFEKLNVEILSAAEEEFNMEYGAGYGCMNILVYFIRSNFESLLNKKNAESIKFLCHYGEEFGTTYYENSRATAYYSGMYYLLTDNVKCNTRTR